MSEFGILRTIPRHDTWIDNVLNLQAPKNKADIVAMIHLFAGNRMSLRNLGNTLEGTDHDRSMKIAETLKVKSSELLSSLESTALTENTDEIARLRHILTRFDGALQKFIDGSHLVGITSETGLLSATLEKADARTMYRKVGIPDSVGKEMSLRKSAQLIAGYEKESLLGPDTVQYLVAGIPIATLEYFFGQFTPEETRTYERWLHQESALPDILSAIPHTTDYVDFVALLVKKNLLPNVGGGEMVSSEYETIYPELDWDETHYLFAVFFSTTTGTPEEKIAFLSECKSRYQLDIESVLMFLKIKDYSLEDLSVESQHYKDVFAPYEIVRLHCFDVDFAETRALYERLPFLLKDVGVYTELLTAKKNFPPERVEEFIDLYDEKKMEEENITTDEQMYSSSLLEWFLEKYDDIKDNVVFLRSRGIGSVDVLFHMCTDTSIPIEYWAEIYGIVGGFSPSSSHIRERIVDWYTAGLVPADIEKAKDMWNEKKGFNFIPCSSRHIKAYLNILTNPEKVDLLAYVCTAYNKVPSQICIQVDEGYSQSEFDAFNRFNLVSVNWFPLLKEFPEIIQAYEKLTPDQHAILLLHSDLPELIGGKIRGGENPDTVLQSLLAQSEEILRKGRELSNDGYAELLESRSHRHGDFVSHFKLFGISPEYMAKQLSHSAHSSRLNETIVNHIIMCAYIENKISKTLLPLIEKYGITSFTRYPAEVLQSMVNEYAQEEDKPGLALCLVAKSDWNGALDDLTKPLQSVYAKHKLYIYEVGSKNEFYRAIQSFGEEAKRKGALINLICFDSHGSDEVLQLGFPYNRARTELSTKSIGFYKPLREYFSPDAQMVIAACSTARRTKTNDNVAYQFAKAWPGVEVFASNTITATTDIVLNDIGRVTSVRFSAPDALEVIKLDASTE